MIDPTINYEIIELYDGIWTYNGMYILPRVPSKLSTDILNEILITYSESFVAYFRSNCLYVEFHMENLGNKYRYVFGSFLFKSKEEAIRAQNFRLFR